MNVYRPDENSVSVEYTGSPISKAHALWLRGLYASTSLYDASDNHVTAFTLSAIARGCIGLDEEQDEQVAERAGVKLVSGRRMMVARYKTFEVLVLQHPELETPIIQINRPNDASLSNIVTTVAAFNESWLRDYDVKAEAFGSQSYLLFYGGFLDYYDEDPLAFQDSQSIYQAPLKANVWAHSRAIGLMGLVDE